MEAAEAAMGGGTEPRRSGPAGGASSRGVSHGTGGGPRGVSPRRRVRVLVPATSANLGPGFDCLWMALPIFNVVELEERPGLFGSRDDFVRVTNHSGATWRNVRFVAEAAE